MVPSARWLIAILILPALLLMFVAKADTAHDSPALATSLTLDYTFDPSYVTKRIAVDPATDRIYVLHNPITYSGIISVIDGATNSVIGTIESPDAYAIAVNPITERVYVVNRPQSTLSVYDANSLAFLTTIPTGSAPSDVAVNTVLNRIYVANEGSGTLSVIDGATGSLIANVQAGVFPLGLEVMETTNRVYVFRYGPTRILRVTDLGSSFSLSSISFPFDFGAGDTAVDPATNRIYAAGIKDGTDWTLVYVDGVTEQVTELPGYEGQVVVNSAQSVVYTFASGQIAMLDAVTDTELGTFGTGSGGGVVNEATDRLYFVRLNNATTSRMDIYDDDSDLDGIGDIGDNCPDDANAGQEDMDTDGTGDACDLNVDGGWLDNAGETGCGSDPADAANVPERVDLGGDEDGDTLVDEALPAGAEAYDCDGDGYVGTAEALIFGGPTDRDQDACGVGGWPSDLNSSTGPPDSFNRVNILDIVSFIAPVKYLGTNVGTNPGDARWDVLPGPGIFPTDINLSDLTALIAGPTGFPPMLDGAKAMGGPVCPWAP